MKKTDLEKNKGLKINGQLASAQTPARFGHAADAMTSRKEQRKRDQAAGLVPFATKLNAELVKELHARALASNQELSVLIDDLLRKGLAASAS